MKVAAIRGTFLILVIRVIAEREEADIREFWESRMIY
jgi:hypothetical protein